MSVFRNCLVGTGLLLCVSLQTTGQRIRNHLPQSKHQLVVIAHRGNHTQVPENTLAALNEAIKSGVDYVEIDLRTTKDGHLIIHHDETVDRATNGSGKIKELTLAEIKKLQVYNHNHKTHRIPEFHDILKLCKDRINIYLDFKDADVAQTWKAVQDAGMEKQIVVYLNKKDQYSQWKIVSPQTPLMTSIPEEVTNKEQLAAFLGEIKIDVVDNVVNPEVQEALRAEGIPVWYDVQSPKEGSETWGAALHKNVQGLQTDHPEALIGYLNKHGFRNGLK